MARKRQRKGILKGLGNAMGFLIRFIWKVLPIGIACGIVLFVFLGIRNMLYADPYFRVERVTVFPSGVLNDAEYRYLEAQVRGKSLLEVNLKDVSRKLGKDPRIKKAEVVRTLPNQLKVYLTTRTPVMQVHFSQNGPFYLIGGDRMVLSIRQIPEPNLMSLDDFDSNKKNYMVGTLYQSNAFDRAVEIIGWLKSDPLMSREGVSKLIEDDIGNFSVIMNDGIELKLGKTPIKSDAKKALLNTILLSAERNDVLYIDFRYNDVIVKKKTVS